MSGVPRLYEALYEHRVFTTDEAVDITGEPKEKVVKQLSYLRENGFVDKIRRGLYAIIPLDSRPEPAIANPYLVASKLAEPYILSYHTGLELHGVAQSTFYLMPVATPERFTGFEHQDIEYRRVKIPLEHVQAARTPVTIEDQEIHVANREWTIAHCVKRLDLAGGFEEVMKSIAGFAYVDPEGLFTAARMLRTKALFNRIGFILDHFSHKWDITEDDIEPFRANLSRNAGYFGTKPGKATYQNEWKIMVPHDIDKVTRGG